MQVKIFNKANICVKVLFCISSTVLVSYFVLFSNYQKLIPHPHILAILSLTSSATLCLEQSDQSSYPFHQSNQQQQQSSSQFFLHNCNSHLFLSCFPAFFIFFLNNHRNHQQQQQQQSSQFFLHNCNSHLFSCFPAFLYFFLNNHRNQQQQQQSSQLFLHNCNSHLLFSCNNLSKHIRGHLRQLVVRCVVKRHVPENHYFH